MEPCDIFSSSFFQLNHDFRKNLNYGLRTQLRTDQKIVKKEQGEGRSLRREKERRSERMPGHEREDAAPENPEPGIWTRNRTE
jgi:hypothetical protein